MKNIVLMLFAVIMLVIAILAGYAQTNK